MISYSYNGRKRIFLNDRPISTMAYTLVAKRPFKRQIGIWQGYQRLWQCQ